MKRIPPGVTLLLLAPLLGELVSAHQTLFEFANPLQFVLLALPYGFGAIVCRELVVRWNKGWTSLVLLGIAYGIYEEAIVARSIWDPEWTEFGALGEYSFRGGVAWTWAAVTVHFHLLVSILCSVKLAELLHPDSRGERWVGNRGLLACFVGLALWAPALWLVHPFTPPAWAQLVSWALVIGLGVAAWRLPKDPWPRREGTGARPLAYFGVAALDMALVFLLVFALPEWSPRWLPPWPVSLLAVLLLDLGAWLLVRRWSGDGRDWDDRHRLALCAGMLAFFVPFDVLKDLTEGFGGSSLVAVATVWFLWRLWRRTERRIVG